MSHDPRTVRAAPAAAGLLALTYLGFVSLGLPDAAYGVAWPSLRDDFGLRQSSFGLGLLFVALGFLVSSLSAGTLLARFGAGRLLAGSTLVTASGLVGFAFAPSWPLFLASGLLAGLGGGAIDSGLNTYAAAHYSARHMNWLHAAFGIGAALGPLAMAAALARAEWQLGYLALASAMGLLTLLFFATRRRWDEGRTAAAAGKDAPRVPVGTALRSPAVWLIVATFFVYAGCEIAAGQWAFAILTEGRGYTIEAAGAWTGAFWFALFSGRFLLGFGADAIGPGRLVIGGAAVALASLAFFALDPAGLGVAGLALAGFSLAPIFPMLVHMTPRLIGPSLSAHSIGFQISAAMMGGVAFPALCGVVAGSFGTPMVPVFLAAAAALHLALAVSVLRRCAPMR